MTGAQGSAASGAKRHPAIARRPVGRHQSTACKRLSPPPPRARESRRAAPCPAGAPAGRTAAPASHSVLHRMLASSTRRRRAAPLPRACTCTRCPTALAAAFSRVASSAWGSMSKQCTARAPSLAAASASTPEPQPKSMTRAPVAPWRIEPAEAQRGAGVRAGAEGEPRVERDHDRLRVAHRLVVRAHPQPRPEAHGMEVLEPLALPDAIRDRARGDAAGGSTPSCARRAGRRVRRLRRAAGNRAFRRVWRPQAQLLPAAARAPGHPRHPRSVTALAPQAKQASSAACASSAPRANDSSRKAATAELQRRPSRRSR